MRSKKCPTLAIVSGLRRASHASFGAVHLRRDLAAHIAQRVMPAGVDPVGVVDGAMVHPYDHVAFGRLGRTHRQRDARRGRARPASRWRRSPTPATTSGGRPDVCRPLRAPPTSPLARCRRTIARRSRRLAPDGDWPPGAGDELSGGIENAGPGAERADVNPDVGLASLRPWRSFAARRTFCRGRDRGWRSRPSADRRANGGGSVRSHPARSADPPRRTRGQRAGARPRRPSRARSLRPSPGSRAGISAPSARRHRRTAPSA